MLPTCQPLPPPEPTLLPTRPLAGPEIPRLASMSALGLAVSSHLSRCRRQGGALSVIWMEAQLQAADSDCPPGARDAAMQALSRRLRNRVRSTDDVLQVGDEGFAVLLPLTGSIHAAIVVARLRQVLRGTYGVDGALMQAEPRLGAASFPEHAGRGMELAVTARRNCHAGGGA